MKKAFLADSITYFFILLFLYTGVAKLLEAQLFKEQLLSSPLMGSIAGLITWALPIGELILAIALFIPALKLKALYATLTLMSLFTAYVVALLFIDDQLSCNCGGIIEELSPKQHILFNGICVVLSVIAILIYRRQQRNVRLTWLAGTFSICLFLVIGWILFTAFPTPASVKTGMEGRVLPSFDLLGVDSTTHFNTDEIPKGKPFIIIGFSPTCTHCGAETDDIIKHMDQLKDTHIYFLSPYPLRQIRGFYHYFKLGRYPNITMWRDSQGYFFQYFKTTLVPYTVVYDSKKRLKQVFNIQTDAKNLFQAVTK
jgi:hypothetical protein